jgi:hypothetical protein
MSELVRRSETIELLRRFEEAGALTPTRLSLASRPDLTFEQFKAIGIYLSRVHDGTKFWVADWYLEGEQRFGEEMVQAVTATGRSERTLLNWVWVARSVPPSRRRENLTFTHHAIVAPLEPAEQAEWLDRAECDRWSSRELQGAIKDRGVIASGSVPGEGKCPDLDDVVDEIHARLRPCYGEVEVVIRVSGVAYRVGPR